MRMTEIPTLPQVQTRFGPRLKEVLENGYDLGLADYPIYDESFRPVLNQRIVDHFYLREIGAETPEIFIFYLNRQMRENMGPLNFAFAEIADPKYSPFENTDTTTEYDQDSQSNGSTKGDTSTVSEEHKHDKAVNSNAPQVNVSDPESDMKHWNTGQFGHSDANGTNQVESKSNTNDKSLAHYIGRTHGQAGQLKGDILNAYLADYANPLQEVFSMLEPCFSQLFTSSVPGL